MPSDIRSFFGGKGFQASGIEESVVKPAKEPQRKTRGKRRVVSDSDDEEQQPSAKKLTPAKPPPTRTIKRESPAGEIITSSDYFTARGKSKPSRSTPSKIQKGAFVDTKATQGSPSLKSPIATPQNKNARSPKPPSSNRTSSRKRMRLNYAEDEDIDEVPSKIVNDEEASGDDIFKVDYVNGRNRARDEYQSSDDQANETEDIKSTSRSKTKDTRSGPSGHNRGSISRKTERDDSTAGAKANRTTKEHTGESTRRGRKRKSIEVDNHGDNNDDGFGPSPKKTNSAKTKSPRKSVTKKGHKENEKVDVNVRSDVQDIFDGIPTIRPPTPPPRHESQKFDFRAAAKHTQPVPAAAGSKEIPTGAENCLAGLSFVFTGLLDSLGREKGIELVKQYGGKVTTGPSSRTSYVVLGSDAGPKKLQTIQQHKLKTINEEGLFALIRRLPANGGDGKAAEKFEEKRKEEEKKVVDLAAEMDRQEKETARKEALAREAANARNGIQPDVDGKKIDISNIDTRLWTVKYAPTSSAMICGNKTQVDKLQAWLRAWPSNLRTKFKKAGKDGHGVFRAVMIHGPPGIGKTTAAHLAAKLEGYDIVESNASDTRSKKLVETGLRGVLDTTSLLGYFAGNGKKVEVDKKKLVLIMDEVDGMSAGDRGGVGALASVCKKTSIPMILICNDRKLPKMKPFDFVTYDLPFRRPTVDQIRSRIMTICYREGIKIPPNVINALIEGTRSDIRQIINMLSTAKLNQDTLDFDQSKTMSKSWEKHIILKPWDIVSKILGGGMFAPSSTSTLNDKIELYFNDHEFSPLMLQENYLGTNPMLSNSYTGKERSLKLLELTDNAAESISDGDLVDRMIHGSQQHWSLMPTHAVFSFVRPASFISGSQAGNQTRFTSWLGNNSKQGKLMRYVKEIQAHMRLRASGDRHEIRQQYLPTLWYRLVKDLEHQGKDGVQNVIALMDSYFLTREDWDAIFELGVGPMDSESVKLDTQTKAAFTRLYNLQSHPLPFMKASNVVMAKKASKEQPDLEEAIEASEEGEDSGPDADPVAEEPVLDLKTDKYVKAPKKSAAKKGGAKRKAKAQEDGDDIDGSDEDVKPKKGKVSAIEKTGTARGRPKK